MQSDQQRLADSLVIAQEGVTLDFTLQVLRDWYAARAIIEGTTSIHEILPASDRWLTALQIVIDSAGADAGDAVRVALAASDPGLAGLVMDDRARAWRWEETICDHVESPLETGDRLWKAMTAWGRGLGKLFSAVGPVRADGRTATLGVRGDSRTITTSWYQGHDILGPVVQLPDRADLDRRRAEWPVLHTEMTRGNQREWPWLTARDYLVKSLSETIKTRRLALPSHDAVRELAWAFALAAKDQPRFRPEPIRLAEVARTVDAIGRAVETETDGIRVGRLRLSVAEFRLVQARLSALEERGDTVIADPWPPFDQVPPSDKRPWYTWDFFSDPRLLARARVIYLAALRLYTEMLERWFDGFRKRLPFGRLLPVRLDGHLTRSEQRHFEGAPVLEWGAKVVPLGEHSSVSFSWGPPNNMDLLSYWKEEKESLRTLRPGLEVSRAPVREDGMRVIDGSRPATDLAHDWLIHDLRALGWSEMILLSSE